MLAFVLRRLLQSIAVMAVVAFIAFGPFNFTVDPVSFTVGQDATAGQRAQLRHELGLDRPFYVQFIQAVSFADIPVMAAYLCFIALVFVLPNLVFDLLYYAVDPRLRVERPGLVAA